MLQKIHTSDGPLDFNIEPIARALGPELARQTLERYAFNRSGARMRRIFPVLTNFFAAHPDLLRRTSSELEHSLSEYFFDIFYGTPEKAYSTRATEWDSIRLFVNHLIKTGILPEFPILRTRSYTSFFNETDTGHQNNHLAPPRELFLRAHNTSKADLYKEFPEFQEILKQLPEYPTDEEFLEIYESDQERLIARLRTAATEIVRKAHADFCRGEELIETGQMNDIFRAISQTGHAIDSNVRTPPEHPSLTAIIRNLVHQADSVEGITKLNSEILTKYVVRRLSIPEIAAQKNTTETNVRAHLRRVRQKLDGLPTFSRLISFLEEKTLATRKACREQLSFFSPDHPQGLANIVAATAFLSCGVVCTGHKAGTASYRPFPGHRRYSDHEGGAKQIAAYLGLTPRVAIALQTLIILETGCNVDSLRRATIQHALSTPLIRRSESPGFDVLTLKKPRANRYQEFVIPEGSVDQINASFSVRFAIRLTKRLRDATNDPHLWLYSDSLKPGIRSYRISDSTLKVHFRRLFTEHPLLMEYAAREPSVRKLRTTVGILRWLQTGGSLSAASSQLNNLARTAATSYIPSEIQTAYYSNQIARFQSLLVEQSIAGTSKPFSPKRWATNPSRSPLITNSPATTTYPALQKNATLLIWEEKRLATVLAAFELLVDLKATGEIDDNPDSIYWGMKYKDWRTLALFIKHHGQTTTSRQHKIIFGGAIDDLPSCRDIIRTIAINTIQK